MNPRIVTAVTGTIILALGLAALFFPQLVMTHVLGFAVDSSHAANAVLGEVRATYGGLFVVMGVFALLAVTDPAANRARLTFIGLLWLGACGGRLLSVSLDGDPGLPGWLGVVFELLMGSALLVAAWIRSPAPPAMVSSLPPTTPIAVSTPPPALP